MRWNQLVLAALLAIFSTSFAYAQMTGQIIGTVADQQGAVLPGVTVTATSPQLQGERTAVTDSTGTFRIPSLPPGTYAVKVSLSGFQDLKQENVTVSLDKTASLNMKMQLAGMTTSVEVTAQSPVIDTTSAAGGVTVDQAMMQRLPVARNFYGTARFAPGVTTDAVGPTMLGSSGAENKYIIDGIDATGIQTGSQMKTVLVDFIDQVNVKTQGANAEFGGFTGGMVEAITKSGSNQFAGNVFGFFQGGSLQQGNSTASQRPQTTTTVGNIAHQYDGGFTAGGPIQKDRLWFFGGYNPFNERDEASVIRPLGTTPGTPGVGETIPATTTRNLYSGKVTYKAGRNQNVDFSVVGDPSKQKGYVVNPNTIAGPPSTFNGTLESGSADFRGSYNGVFANNWLITGLAARHHELQTYSGEGTTIPAIIDQTVSPNLRTGGFAGFENHNFKRDEYRGDVTRYQGAHTIKGGFGATRLDSRVDRYSGGAGQQVNILQSGGVLFYRHRYYVNDLAPGFDRSDPSTWQIALPLTSEPKNNNLAAYAQDQWRVLPNFTIEGGVRWERRKLGDRFGNTVIDLSKNWAPRIGFSWDPKNDGKSKVFAHYGRYFEDIPMDINIRSFGGELTAFSYNFSPDPANFLPDLTAPKRSTVLGGPEAVDPALTGQFIEEWLVGAEREIAPSLTVGVRYNHRRLMHVIEDFLVPSQGEYFIANPGLGTLGQTLSFYDQVSTAPSPQAKRNNDMVELTASKRFSHNWQFLASYVWSRLEGNYDGTFQNSTGQLDPNINSAFDYADFLINAQGRLTNDRTSQLKLDGAYQFNHGPLTNLQLGLSTHWYSGLPLTAYGYSFAYSNWEYYLTPRGSLGTGPSDYEADVHIGYPIKVGGRATATLNADIFNVLGRQAITVLDQRYNLIQDGSCAGIPDGDCNGDGGLQHAGSTLNPVAQLSNPKATATNPDFLKASANTGTPFTGQRSLRLGIRFTW
jgi:hypothetical protein